MSDPTFAAPPPPPPPKKKKTGKILLIVGLVVVVVCIGGAVLAYSLLGKVVDVAYAEGNCIDQLPTSTTASSGPVPKPVDCTDSSAQSKILKVFDDKTFADGEELCGNVGGAVSYIEIQLNNNTSKLLCLGPN